MSRYVDAKWLEKVYEIKPARCSNKGYLIPIPFVIESINKAPSINIVRCRECRYWAYGKDLCTLHDMGMMADDFCSYGEKNNE